MKKGLITASIVLILMSIYIMIESSRLERTMQMGVGIGFLPYWAGALIGFLAWFLFVMILWERIAFEDKPVFAKGNISMVIYILVSIILYLIFTDIIGYAISTFLFLFSSVFILQERRVLYNLCSSVVFTFLLYAIFKLWLKSPLPAGFLGI